MFKLQTCLQQAPQQYFGLASVSCPDVNDPQRLGSHARGDPSGMRLKDLTFAAGEVVLLQLGESRSSSSG
jgi:hypothetical protein